MQPPRPPTYSLVDADGWKFADGWQPASHILDSCGCPIRFNWNRELANIPSRRAKAELLRYEILRPSTEQGHQITVFRLYYASHDPKRPTLLYSKGNSFDLGILRFHCLQLALLLDVDVIAYDYSGYGASQGIASPSSTLADARAAFACAAQYATRLYLYGFSLGNGPTLYLASRAENEVVSGVILRSAFASGVAAATDIIHTRVTGWIPAFSLPYLLDVWPNTHYISRVSAPTLVIHGENDELLSMWHARQLLANSKTAVTPFIQPDMGHFDVERHPAYLSRLHQFIHSETCPARVESVRS